MSGQNQFLLYTAPDGAVRVEVFFKDETVWLTQKSLAGQKGPWSIFPACYCRVTDLR